MRALVVVVLVGLSGVLSSVLLGCSVEPANATFAWSLPPGFVAPPIPTGNAMSTAKVELGRYLFYDTALSANGTHSCASCHDQARAFTDGLATSRGATGEHGRHGAMSIANAAYAASLTWAGNVATLEAQALVPMYGSAPIELGLVHERDGDLLARLDSDRYGDLFAAAFPDEDITVATVVRAIASFERTILSGRARFDRFVAGDPTALTPQEQTGMALFQSARLACTRCHGGFALTSAVAGDNRFFNTGLYDIDGHGGYPTSDRGLVEITGEPKDEGRFRPPTLRNIALTAPYLHDGSAATLDDVLDIYATGGRGPGATSVHKSPLIHAFTIDADDRAALLAFLGALTDDTLLTDPAFSNPW